MGARATRSADGSGGDGQNRLEVVAKADRGAKRDQFRVLSVGTVWDDVSGE